MADVVYGLKNMDATITRAGVHIPNHRKKTAISRGTMTYARASLIPCATLCSRKGHVHLDQKEGQI